MSGRCAVILCALVATGCGLDLGPTPAAVPAPTGNSTFGIVLAPGVTDGRADQAARARCRINGRGPIFVERIGDVRAYRCTSLGVR